MGPQQVVAARRFAVIGDPIEHSLSPVLHRAAYEALGVTDASYERFRVAADAFWAFAESTLPTLSGVSVTMPHKRDAHRFASVHDRHAYLGVANTLIPRRGGLGWAAFNTDIEGIVSAFRHAGVEGAESATIFGSGATASSLGVALLEIGVRSFTLCARSPQKLDPLRGLLDSRGAQHSTVAWENPARACGNRILASALAISGAEALVQNLGPEGALKAGEASAFFDVLYHPAPTPLERLVTGAGQDAHATGPTWVPGSHMLAFQAARQVELMFEIDEAPEADMLAALEAHLTAG